ncbi:hypothetical protein HNQ69_000369 [Bartonella callosciuri]|uniref:Uncharacterized protein n=1 Tax=Bartonella callosciuri TaxID=686223 RepID=A0A840NTI5_9HYPH|nr:hypothetical protein [Bartonella callosciuri]
MLRLNILTAVDTIFIKENNDSVDLYTMASRLVYNCKNRFEAETTTYTSWCYGCLDESITQKLNDVLFQKDPWKRAQRIEKWRICLVKR